MVLPRFAGIRPATVLPCASTADVVAAVSEARRAGRPVAVRGGGHCFAGRSSTTGTVIDVSPLTGVRADGDRVVVGAGTRLAELYDRLAAHGRTVPAGCGATVGIAGLTLGGGLGILGRRHGLTCDSLLAATVVLADGTVTEAGDDLLWALRGGGAPGVVTSLTFRTVPAPDSTAFRLTFPAPAAADVLDAWQHALPELDEAYAPSLVITAPPLSVTVFGAAPGPAAVDHLIRLIAVRPSTDERQHGTHHATKQWLAGDGDIGHAYLRSEFFRQAVPAAELIDRLNTDHRPGEQRELDFNPWGGAYNRVPADATAFPHRDARFLLKQTATVGAGERPGPWLESSYAITHPYGTGGAYPNFPEPDLPPEAYSLGNTDRLRRIHASHDPDRMFT
ncbi:FAD-binding oxidoreductase [Actinoplanes aureus]|uniref:FAD-binding protein n=1 Tax=Actinoplanes aureus TaxID=2792083 RepID=A0A931G4Q9_9ACTN|nr:FAD-dependent oxidoreductase [Actinoplanes aureus]MBG0565529.1 FAD-binding protein [Actinoplanes aureus]